MKQYPIGVLLGFNNKTDLDAEFKKVKDMELQSCQLCIWDDALFRNPDYAKQIRAKADEYGVIISSLWAGWSGPMEWNFTGGPSTLGLVPEAYRFQRLQELDHASIFAGWLGIDKVITHVGFIPENPDHPDFTGVVTALRWLCRRMKARKQFFLFETGQETPITMLRTIQAIGTDNLGINFDTANLILYGKANSLDALDIYGKYVMNTHIKDGNYPTDGMSLGKEVPAGEGRANIAGIIKKLHELGYEGHLTIEREISGDKQIEDIKNTRKLLMRICRYLKD